MSGPTRDEVAAILEQAAARERAVWATWLPESRATNPGAVHTPAARAFVAVAEAEAAARADLLQRRATSIRDCGRYRVAQVRKAPPVDGGVDEPRLVPARCRARGCPDCDAARGRVVRARALALASAVDGLDPVFLTATLPGDPSQSLRERATAMRAAFSALRASPPWVHVAGALMFLEAPYNRWRGTDRHHWHLHAHVIVWLRPGAPDWLWGATDGWGRRLDLAPAARAELRRLGKEAAGGGAAGRRSDRRRAMLSLTGVSRAWAAAVGVAPGRVRLQVQVPYLPDRADAARSGVAVAVAAAYAAKYAAKSGAPSARAELVAWVLESVGIRLHDAYGAARGWWAATEQAAEWQAAAPEAELVGLALELSAARDAAAAAAAASRAADERAAAADERAAAAADREADWGAPIPPAVTRAAAAAGAAAARAEHRAAAAAARAELSTRAARLLGWLWRVEEPRDPAGELAWWRARPAPASWAELSARWRWVLDPSVAGVLADREAQEMA